VLRPQSVWVASLAREKIQDVFSAKIPAMVGWERGHSVRSPRWRAKLVPFPTQNEKGITPRALYQTDLCPSSALSPRRRVSKAPRRCSSSTLTER